MYTISDALLWRCIFLASMLAVLGVGLGIPRLIKWVGWRMREAAAGAADARPMLPISFTGH